MSRLFEKVKQGQIGKVHFQGDSITQGCGFLSQQQSYVRILIDKFTGASGCPLHVYNHAVGGATAVDGLNRIHWCEREDHLPDLTFIMFGLNDVNQGVPIDTYGDSLRAMIDRLKQVDSDVVLLGPTPFPAHDQQIRDFSQRASDVAQQAEVAFVDCLSPFYASGEVPAGLLWPDGVHLTPPGHEFLGQVLCRELMLP